MLEILGKDVGRVGYGLMGLTIRQPMVPQEQAFAAMKAALDSGCNLWNAGNHYGTPEYNSQILLATYFKRYPEDADKVVLSVKGGYDFATHTTDGSPEGLKKHLDKILKDLDGTKKVDIFECARIDPRIPLEVTFKFLEEECVKKGIIGGISLTEVSAATVRKVAAITKIAFVENEVSLWATESLENGVSAACAEFNIPLVAYSPLGLGMLTGRIKSLEDMPNDYRRMYPRFHPDNFHVNLQLVEKLEAISEDKGCTAAQLAISWVVALGKKPGMPVFVPIPGATTEHRVRENARVVELTEDDMAAIDKIQAQVNIVGRRGPEVVALDT